jgi:hypothetical protein
MTEIPLNEQIEKLKEAVITGAKNEEILVEAMRDLEDQAREQGWQVLFGGASDHELSKTALNTINNLARVNWLKQPLIKRPVELQVLYVFAQGMTVKATHPDVDAMIKKFLEDPENTLSFSSHLAREMNERALRIDGNLMFALFTNQSTGRVIVRYVPFYEVTSIICNPEDRYRPWYYLRSFTVDAFSTVTGLVTPTQTYAYHPDWRYNPEEKPEKINGFPVHWEAPIMHVKVNCLPDMKYGVSEVYAALDWAKAYKIHLENGSKLWQAFARFAFALTTKGGSGAVAAAKERIKGILTPSTATGTTDQKPVASVFTSGEGVKLDTIKTSGVTTSMDDARRFMLQSGSATGTPEHMLAMDPSTSNLATSKTMERPLELQFVSRQTLWIGIWGDVLNYVIDQSIKAENGILKGTAETDEYTGQIRYVLTGKIETDNPDAEAESIPRTVSITFPPLLEHDIVQTMAALISGATLDGKPLAGTIDMKTLTREVFKALKIENAEDLIEKMYPGDTLIMQTDYAAKSQAAAAAQALALAQQRQQTQPGQPPADQQPPGKDNQQPPPGKGDAQPPADDTQPPGSVQESVATAPLVVENTQAYQETQAALIAARRKFADAILKGLAEHYPESTKA